MPGRNPSPDRRPRGRPRAFDRNAAVKTALDLFLRNGYDGVSISQLVDAIGISPPSLYSAFGSKDGLYREALNLYIEGRGRFVSRALANGQGIRAQVRQILRDAAAAFAPTGKNAPGCLVSTDLHALTPGNEAVALHVRSIREAQIDAIAKRIDAARQCGELPADADGKDLARFYAAVIAGMALQAKGGATRKQLTALADLALEAWPRRRKQ
jgi:AcrR family transcriptional regulator